MNPEDLVLDKAYLCFMSNQKTSKARYYFAVFNIQNCLTYYFTEAPMVPFRNFTLSDEGVRSSIKEVTPLWNILYDA